MSHLLPSLYWSIWCRSTLHFRGGLSTVWSMCLCCNNCKDLHPQGMRNQTLFAYFLNHPIRSRESKTNRPPVVPIYTCILGRVLYKGGPCRHGQDGGLCRPIPSSSSVFKKKKASRAFLSPLRIIAACTMYNMKFVNLLVPVHNTLERDQLSTLFTQALCIPVTGVPSP